MSQKHENDCEPCVASCRMSHRKKLYCESALALDKSPTALDKKYTHVKGENMCILQPAAALLVVLHFFQPNRYQVSIEVHEIQKILYKKAAYTGSATCCIIYGSF